MTGRFTIGANVLQAVLTTLEKQPYAEVVTLINAIRTDVKPLEEPKEENKPKEVPKKKE